MRNLNSTFNNADGIIFLKNEDWLSKQRIAGKVVGQALSLLESQIKNKTKYSLIELNNLAEEFILNQGCELTFKGYKGFPTGVCISVNKQLVHGIPTNYYLQDGDIVSFDLGATFEGAIADSAITCIYGEPKSERHIELLKVTKMALIKGIEAITVGKRLGCIGNAMYKYVINSGYNVITKYGGHGLTWDNPHCPPFVSNKSTCDEGIRIQPGLTIAIEPLVCLGSPETSILLDNWTVVTSDLSSHEEHTIYVHENYNEIITERK